MEVVNPHAYESSHQKAECLSGYHWLDKIGAMFCIDCSVIQFHPVTLLTSPNVVCHFLLNEGCDSPCLQDFPSEADRLSGCRCLDKIRGVFCSYCSADQFHPIAFLTSPNVVRCFWLNGGCEQEFAPELHPYPNTWNFPFRLRVFTHIHTHPL